MNKNHKNMPGRRKETENPFATQPKQINTGTTFVKELVNIKQVGTTTALWLFAVICIFTITAPTVAQVNAGFTDLLPGTSSSNGIFHTNGVMDISGSGRFAVVSSNGNLATEFGNRNNADGNNEIFLYDYAQRRIFQITNTVCAPGTQANNVFLVDNSSPKISNDGRWIVFVSNATSSTVSNPNNSNPGSFDGNVSSNAAALQADGNTEIWLYRIPEQAFSFQGNLSSGAEAPYTDLSVGSFIQVTNSAARSLPQEGTAQTNPFISGDNLDPSISDSALLSSQNVELSPVVAFVSNRDYVIGLNSPGPNPNDPQDNSEIFVYNPQNSSNNRIKQITRTPRYNTLGTNRNTNPSISGIGNRVVFTSNATNPIRGTGDGANADLNNEVFFSDLDEYGDADGIKVQITQVTRVDYEGDNILSDRSISRDGRYILLLSRAALETTGRAIDGNFGFYLYDSNSTSPCYCEPERFRRLGPREQPNLLHGISRFTDYNQNRTPQTVIFTSRVNMNIQGLPPATPEEGLNTDPSQPPQVYAYSINSTVNPFARIGSFSNLNFATRAFVYPSNTRRRMIGTYQESAVINTRREEVYLITPEVNSEDSNIQLSFYTGASSLAINANPSEAAGLAPNMLGTVSFTLPSTIPAVNASATGTSTTRPLSAPIELGGVTITIDGVATQIKNVTGGRIDFIVPQVVGLGSKPVVINYNGLVVKGSVNIVQTQPDILTTQLCPCYGGGRARIFNVTDPSTPQSEPFALTTRTSNGPVPTKLRLYITGVEGATAGSISISIGGINVSSILTGATATNEPGVFTIDFTLPQLQSIVGDMPIVVTITRNGQSVQTRSAITAPRLRIIAEEPVPNDLAVWRRSTGAWYVLDNSGAFYTAVQWGTNVDITVIGDFDGDKKTDFAVYRPDDPNTVENECENGCAWYILQSSNNGFLATRFGSTQDKPVAADYDGDGKTDIAVRRPSINTWFILYSSNNQSYSQQFGATNDEAVPSDYDGDGKADIAVWRPTDGGWYVFQSTNGQMTSFAWGANNDKPVVGDYDGDGKSDYAVWRPLNGVWHIRLSGNGQTKDTPWGYQTSDIAVQGDYDSDGKTDIAVWRPSNGTWFILQSRYNEQLRAVQWGSNGDIPVPAPYRRTQ